jgi:hypothetical protein
MLGPANQKSFIYARQGDTATGVVDNVEEEEGRGGGVCEEAFEPAVLIHY